MLKVYEEGLIEKEARKIGTALGGLPEKKYGKKRGVEQRTNAKHRGLEDCL